MPDSLTPALPTALIVMGVSGSGKSTIARDLAQRCGLPMLEADELHPAENIAKMSAGTPLTDADREPWLRIIAERIDAWRQAGAHGVIACSALKRGYRDILRGGHQDVRFVYLAGSYAFLFERMTHRQGHFMPPALLQSQFDALEVPGSDEAITISVEQAEAAVVDEALAKLGVAPVAGAADNE